MSATDGRQETRLDRWASDVRADVEALREVVLTKIAALREVIDERDRLYRERDDSRRTAVDAALAAVKDQTKASFEASEKAIGKAEDAQRAYNTAHNDLSRKLDEQNKATVPRPETEARFHAMEEKISVVKDAQAEIGGAQRGGKSLKDESRANIAILISVIAAAVTIVRAFMK